MKKSSCKAPKEAFRYTRVDANKLDKWWPNRLNLRLFHLNSKDINPKKEGGYKDDFSKLDYKALKEDLKKILRESQSWWPADFGHYGPFFIRMAWHSAGTYRIVDGKGGASTGAQRFAPENSWPDNTNLDKARRLLWPIKKKYGDSISWADLMILAGNVALEDMGFKTFGFAGGREDIWESEEDIFWGEEDKWLDAKRKDEKGNILNPLAAVQMGLIYVNPEGPNGEPNILEAAKDIRDSFRRMGMNDEETVALIVGGHTFGKCHGAADPSKYVGPEPEAAPMEEVGFGWKNSFGEGKGKDTITSGLEGAWTPNPIRWDNSFLEILFKYDWNLVKSSAGAWQWEPVDPSPEDLAPDAHIEEKRNKTIMLTTDLALRYDKEYKKIAKSFLENPKELEEAFAKAWFKLTHRDLGPKSRYLGPEVPKEEFVWQDPIPKGEILDQKAKDQLERMILNSDIDEKDFIYVAWSSASTFRKSDKRGGANGARIALKPQIEWEANEPDRLKRVLKTLKEIKESFNKETKKVVSLADLIVLAGNVSIKEAAKRAGVEIEVPFHFGRGDATEENTDYWAFSYLEPIGDGFRNYKKSECDIPDEELLIDKALSLTLTIPQMSVLLGGMRVLGANYTNSKLGVLTDRVGVLSNDFFVNLLDMGIEWQKDGEIFIGKDRESGDIRYKATRADLIFASNSTLRAQAEYYAQDDKKEQFVKDFVEAWTKVMELDRFDLR